MRRKESQGPEQVAEEGLTQGGSDSRAPVSRTGSRTLTRALLHAHARTREPWAPAPDLPAIDPHADNSLSFINRYVVSPCSALRGSAWSLAPSTGEARPRRSALSQTGATGHVWLPSTRDAVESRLIRT